MTIKELRKKSGLSQAKFSDRYGIPKRTIEDWEAGKRTPPQYVVDMLTYIVAQENVNHKAWCFYSYSEESAAGDYRLFKDRDEAIGYAKGIWASMTPYDRKTATEFWVAELPVEWDDDFQCFEPDFSEYDVEWTPLKD